MKIAVFATGWNGEYLRDMYHGLENSQKNSMTPYICMQVLEDWDQETVLISQSLIFLNWQIWRRTMDFCIRVPRSKKEMSSSGYSNGS